MLELSWKVFSQTGNIETYLLFKELENGYESLSIEHKTNENKLNEETMQKLL